VERELVGGGEECGFRRYQVGCGALFAAQGMGINAMWF
jgi:hypothetical protein